MPFRHPPRVRLVILERLAAGERLKHICREADMPCHESVTGWMRRDADFAAAVAQARVRGEWRRRFSYDEAKGQAFLARVAAGEPIGRVLGDPAMPSRATYRHWLMTEAPFAEAIHRLRGHRTAGRAEWARGRLRAYDPAVGQRLYVRLWKGERLRDVLRSDPAFPSLAVLARWRAENSEFDAMLAFVLRAWRGKRRRAGQACTPQLTARIVERLAQGASLRSLGGKRGMPSARTLYNWHRTDPEFAAAVDWACRERELWYSDRILAAVERMDVAGLRATKKAIAPLNAQLVRLRKRPGWKRRRAEAAAGGEGGG